MKIGDFEEVAILLKKKINFNFTLDRGEKSTKLRLVSRRLTFKKI